ncbi:MAG TPA: hypothetical protein VFF30_02910 [Nitrososphaerales archaeon]|nr:hypothetical protein [Nitrososphaerales archaeon]
MVSLVGVGKVLFGLFLLVFLASLAEWVAFFFIGPDTPFQLAIGWQMVLSIFFLFLGVSIYALIDMTRR